MAYVETKDLLDVPTTNGHCYDNVVMDSRRSSLSSEMSAGNKENIKDNDSNRSHNDNKGGDSNEHKVIILQGRELSTESRTENVYENHTTYNSKKLSQSVKEQISSGGTAKAKAAKSPYIGPVSPIPDVDITIPDDGNISDFTSDQLANFLQCLKIDERIISHLHRKSVDGKRFSKLKDSELESLGMKSAVVLFFREKSSSSKKGKFKGSWML